MRHGFDELTGRTGISALGVVAVAAQIIAATMLLLPLAGCGGSPMSVESRYVEPGPVQQPTVDQQLALEQQKARRGHN